MSELRPLHEECLNPTTEEDCCENCVLVAELGMDRWSGTAAEPAGTAMFHQCKCSAEYWACIGGDGAADRCEQCITECAFAADAVSAVEFYDNSEARGSKCSEMVAA